MPLTIDVRRADASEKPVVGRLLELNAYEFSRFDRRALRDDGTFGYRYLDSYWDDQGRHPYLVLVDGELAGLALVRLTATWSMAEFLVLPKFRRSGVGTSAARAVFARHPGQWEVREIAGNDDAVAFWRGVIPVIYDESVDAGGTTQRFAIPG
jgi:predicted acetyltransferase